jgi:hypothetical protein
MTLSWQFGLVRVCVRKFRKKHMRPPFRSKQEVIINAPVETVWEFNMDITKIPTFHPRVVKVELLSGISLREPGVSCRCHLSGGKTHMR